MDVPATVKCLCGRTVPPLSQHRPGAARPGLRAERKAEWCPDTDTRKKKAEEDAAQAKVAAEAAAQAAPATEVQPEIQPEVKP
jgi:hypothetical protein